MIRLDYERRFLKSFSRLGPEASAAARDALARLSAVGPGAPGLGFKSLRVLREARNAARWPGARWEIRVDRRMRVLLGKRPGGGYLAVDVVHHDELE